MLCVVAANSLQNQRDSSGMNYSPCTCILNIESFINNTYSKKFIQIDTCIDNVRYNALFNKIHR